MGSLLTQPITQKKSEQGEGLGLRYGLSSMQGWRPEMEDAHDVKVGLNYGLDDWSFFAVFDGHAGGCAARYASWNLLEYILRDKYIGLGEEIGRWPLDTEGVTEEKGAKEELFLHPSLGKDPPSSDAEIENYPNDTTTTSVPGTQMIRKDEDSSIASSDSVVEKPSLENKSNQAEIDTTTDKVNQKKNFPKSTFISAPLSEQLDMVKNAIRSGFLKMDQDMRRRDLEMSGCTAVCSLISPTHIFIANCGDSRAVLYDGTSPKFVTEDHKPFNPKERKRIIEAGGTATVRINGTLAVSRALGDFEFKKDEFRGQCEQLVSPEPEITIIERHIKDEFLILACDGIWDVINNEDLCQFVRYKLMIEPSIENICSSVLDVCLRKGSRDNMSIIIVVFETGPKAYLEEIERDKRNDELLLKIADEHQEKLEESELSFPDFLISLKSELDQESSAILPPGAGIEAKYDLLRERFLKNNESADEKAVMED